MRTSRNTYRAAEAARAKVLAAQEELTGEPMHRWPHVIPTCAAPAPDRTGETDLSPAMAQVLEQLQCQNQLLVDLLGAVNSLTAAVLARGGKT